MNATRESLIASGMVKPVVQQCAQRPSPRAVKRVMSRVNAIIARRTLVNTQSPALARRAPIHVETKK